MKPPRRPPKPAAAPLVESPPGHFTALMRKPSPKHPYGWPHDFKSQIGIIEVRMSTGDTPSEVARRNREKALAEGRTYAHGTIPGMSTSKAIGLLPRAR